MPKRYSALIVQIALVLLLSGCSPLPSLHLSSPALLPPASFGQTLQASQQLEAIVDEEPQQLLIAFAVDNQQLRVTGLTPSGQRLLSINYDGQQTQTSGSHWLPDELDPRMILAQLQLAYWPLDTLQANYPAPWRVTETAEQRQLLHKQTPVWQVDYLNHKTDETLIAGHRISLYDHRFGITLNIRTLSVHSE